MKKILLLILAFLWMVAPASEAATILPTSISIISGSGSFSGTSANVIDGIANYGHYLLFNLSPQPLFRIQLGGNFDLTKLMFNNNGGGAGADTEDTGAFTLTFYNSLSQSVGSANITPGLGEYLQQINISAMNVSRVDMVVTAGTGRSYAIFNEIYFQGTTAVSVPEPCSCVLAFLGMLGLGWMRKSRK